MQLYRLLWSVAVGLLILIGSSITWVTMVFPSELMVAVAAAALVGTVSHTVADSRGDGKPDWRRLVPVSARGAVVGVATAGPINVLGMAAVWMIILVVASSPWALRSILRLYRSTADFETWTTDQPDDQPSVEQDFVTTTRVHGLTNAELCTAWRLSFLALQRSQNVRDQCGIVAARQAHLDELERRDPAGFARWLYSGARPGDDPTRYVTGTSDTPELPRPL